jgi:YebC/PmpR family DNA-binding regulatory protein
MAGHSHWAGIKHKKGKADKQRSKLFSKLSREITVAAKLGLPDIEFNPRLRSAVQAAREANMPKDNITRAIKKSQGPSEDSNYEKSQYEGFGPGGVAFIVEALTDNKNRTFTNLRSLFEKNNSSLGVEGSVSYQFEEVGHIKIKKELITEDEIFSQAIEAGAEDCISEEEHHEIYCKKEKFNEVRVSIETKIKELSFSGIIWKPKNTVSINKEVFEKIINFIDLLEDDEDVQNVYTNFDIDENILKELEL